MPTTPRQKEANREELMATMKASHERIEALMDVSQEMTQVCPETMKSKEPNSEEMKFEAVHEEIPKEEATVKSLGALKKWHGDRHLAVGCHKKLKRRTQGNSGSQKKLAATRRGMT
jgi:hypothetical protein